MLDCNRNYPLLILRVQPEKFAVAAQRQNTVYAAFDHMIDNAAQPLFIEPFFVVDRRDDRGITPRIKLVSMSSLTSLIIV
ncbi:hypothetical protein HMSSN036_11200 [Paenibacillus macerans]|nr:hypothetical protein HMSSN036_11200 [Paenibacillus macerans]